VSTMIKMFVNAFRQYDHPDCLEDEMWIGNVPHNEIVRSQACGHRVGDTAFSQKGQIIPNMRPVFTRIFHAGETGKEFLKSKAEFEARSQTKQVTDAERDKDAIEGKNRRVD